MTNRIAAAHAALETVLNAAFPAPARVFRNPDGMKHFEAGDVVVSMQDDEGVETLRVLSGPIYDLAARPVVTLARKVTETERRDDVWADVETIRQALAVDPTLGGVVEDARPDGVEPAEMDRARWLAGGLDLTIRLLFAAPSAAG